MTARDGDNADDNDPMLRGMRSVWLEMRDEEPPARGLSELMAAARSQAATMTPAEEEEATPWWRRAFAMILRPPVLAAASVVVLIGGAVALKGRGADEAAAPMVTTSERESRDGEVDQGVAKHQQHAITPTTDLPEKAENRELDAFGSAAMSPPRPTASARAADTKSRRADAPKLDKPNIKAAEPLEDKREDRGFDVSAKQKDDSDRARPGLVIANGGTGETSRGRVEEKPATKQSPRRPAPAKPDPVPATTNVDPGDSDKATYRAQVLTEQLIKQTETAANRKDCAAVRVTAERIRKLDAGTYKSRVANQPAIARCLK